MQIPSSAFSSGLFQGLDPNDRPNPDPVTAASTEGQRVRLPNCIRSDTGRIREEAPEGVGSRFVLVCGNKLRPAPFGSSDPALIFSTSYRSISPICMTIVFISKILLINLVRGSMGHANTSIFIFSRSVMSLLFHSPQMI